MGIEITSGGVSKTYRYYPYDAFYVDANGNVNTSGNGQQVKEAWFNGVKYYPKENADAIVFKSIGKATGLTYRAIRSRYDYDYYDAGSYEYKIVYVTAYNPNNFAYRNDSSYGKGIFSRFDRQHSDLTGLDAYGLIYYKFNFADHVTDTSPDNMHIFNRNRFTNESIEIFDRLSNGILIEFERKNFSHQVADSPWNLPYVNEYCVGAFQFAIGKTYYSHGRHSIHLKFDVDANKSMNSEYVNIAPIYLGIGGAFDSRGNFNNKDGLGLQYGSSVGFTGRSETTHDYMFKPTVSDFLSDW